MSGATHFSSTFFLAKKKLSAIVQKHLTSDTIGGQLCLRRKLLPHQELRDI
jgi:hypothetical protein